MAIPKKAFLLSFFTRHYHGSFENEDRSTKHPNLENEAPKSGRMEKPESETGS